MVFLCFSKIDIVLIMSLLKTGLINVDINFFLIISSRIMGRSHSILIFSYIINSSCNG